MPRPYADSPALDWFWDMHPDHQVALVLALASLIGALIWVVRAVRDAPEQTPEASRLDEFESWARPGLVCIACGTPPGLCDGTCCGDCETAGDRFYHTVAGWEAYVELQTFGRDVEVHYEGEL